jgi:ABC-2 type transport system permease protein
MRLSKAWLVALRDFKIFSHQRYVWYSLIIFPIVISVVFPTIISIANARTGGINPIFLTTLLDSFPLFIVIGSAFVPLGIASYTIVGEKVEKSLEPLLASPLTDGEILLGKTFSAFLPTLIVMSAASVVFTFTMNWVINPILGYNYYPNDQFMVLLLLLMPAAIVMSVEYSVLVSSRVNDVRSASNSGIFILFPFLAIYLSSEFSLITLDVPTNAMLAGIVFLVDVALFFLSKAVFNREGILTKWK